jgi:hypothetical protein
MPARSSSARWEGKLKDGNGTMKVGKGHFEGPFRLHPALKARIPPTPKN